MNPPVAGRSEGKCVAARFIAPWGGDRHIPFILVKLVQHGQLQATLPMRKRRSMRRPVTSQYISIIVHFVCS